MLNNKTKEVVVLAQTLKIKEDTQACRSSESESPEVVEEVVQTSGDFKSALFVSSELHQSQS